MAGDRSWVLFVTAACLVSISSVHADTSPRVGLLFVYELSKEHFQNEFPPFLSHYGITYNDPIVFKCNLQNYPDLPRWLRYSQRSPGHDGYLYGTPASADQGRTVIEVTAINRRTYDTVRQRIPFTVGTHGLQIPYQVEFFVPKRDVEEVLPSQIQKNFLNDLEAVWATDRLHVVNITSALDRGGRVPLPLPGLKEGVYIKVGSDVPFSQCLLQALEPMNQQRCSQHLRPILSCNEWFSPHIHIDWCNITLIDLTQATPPAPGPTLGSGILPSEGVYDPPDSPEDREFYLDYMCSIMIPLVLALILFLLLAYIMCCRREGVEKRDAKTPDIQLYHHQTIHDNTDELRTMAGGRSAPRPLSTLPMFNTRTGERMSPLQRPFDPDSSHIPLILAQHDPNTDTLPR